MAQPPATPTAPAARLQAEPGQALHLGLGRTYRLLQPLAPRASTGAVWTAQWLQAQATVAIKWLPPDISADTRPVQHLALEREASALARCQHPHLVRVHTVGRLPDGAPVLVLEQLHEPLHRLLQRAVAARARNLHGVCPPAAGLPLPQALSLAHQLALGLQALHRSGLRHLDVKPANLLLTPPGPLGQRLKLADLGACTPLAQATHPFLGTPGWMAPEQCQPLPDAGVSGSCLMGTDARADVFAVGQVLFYLLTGQGSAWARQSHAAAQSGALVGLQPDQTTGCALSDADLQKLDALWYGTPCPPQSLDDIPGSAARPACMALPTWLAAPHATPSLPPRAEGATAQPAPAAAPAGSPLQRVMRSLCALRPGARCSDMQATAEALHSLRRTWLRQASPGAFRSTGLISSNEPGGDAPGPSGPGCVSHHPA